MTKSVSAGVAGASSNVAHARMRNCAAKPSTALPIVPLVLSSPDTRPFWRHPGIARAPSAAGPQPARRNGGNASPNSSRAADTNARHASKHRRSPGQRAIAARVAAGPNNGFNIS
ncbi:MAG: hypothetical protein K9L70_08460 [Thiohalocapsa sp.]|nr:hypothetical protein [Thiohalocapsa sp.]